MGSHCPLKPVAAETQDSVRISYTEVTSMEKRSSGNCILGGPSQAGHVTLCALSLHIRGAGCINWGGSRWGCLNPQHGSRGGLFKRLQDKHEGGAAAWKDSVLEIITESHGLCDKGHSSQTLPLMEGRGGKREALEQSILAPKRKTTTMLFFPGPEQEVSESSPPKSDFLKSWAFTLADPRIA